MSNSKDEGVQNQAIHLLKGIPLFSGLPAAQLEHLARVAVKRRVTRNTAIVHAGDTTDSLYVIVKGGARVQVSDAEGKEVILTLLGEGECFGEMGMIDGSPRSADVIASDACDLLMISKAEFMRCLSADPELCLNIMKSLVARLREANRKIESLALLDVYGRVAKLLLDFSELGADGQRVVTRKVTKQDMAKMIGASREMVSRVMKDLEESGYIRVEPGRILIDEA